MQFLRIGKTLPFYSNQICDFVCGLKESRIYNVKGTLSTFCIYYNFCTIIILFGSFRQMCATIKRIAGEQKVDWKIVDHSSMQKAQLDSLRGLPLNKDLRKVILSFVPEGPYNTIHALSGAVTLR